MQQVGIGPSKCDIWNIKDCCSNGVKRMAGRGGIEQGRGAQAAPAAGGKAVTQASRRVLQTDWLGLVSRWG